MCNTLSCMHLQRKPVSAQVFGYEKEIVGGRTWRAGDIVVRSTLAIVSHKVFVAVWK